MLIDETIQNVKVKHDTNFYFYETPSKSMAYYTRQQNSKKNLELFERLNNSTGSRRCTLRVLTSDQAAINNMEVIPNTSSTLI